jgi:3-methyladenine DNA glycosylase AlkD
MARYGIVASRAFGVSVGTVQSLAKRRGKDQVRVTRRQMDTRAAGFENWADRDSVCFHLFDRTPFAWAKARLWSRSPREFVKRAGFALMAVLALHDKAAPDKRFLAMLPLIERGARDPRNFVKKAVSWALRSIGQRSSALNTAAFKVARRLALSKEADCRWVGHDAARDLTRPTVRARLARRAR